MDVSIGLCVLMENLAEESDYSAQDVNDFYDAASEFGQLSESPELSGSTKAAFVKSFPTAIEKAAELTNEIAQAQNSTDLKLALRSKIEVVVNDLFEVYKTAVNGDVSSDVEENIQKLQYEIAKLNQAL